MTLINNETAAPTMQPLLMEKAKILLFDELRHHRREAMKRDYFTNWKIITGEIPVAVRNAALEKL
jgi:hypothetical protein